MKVLTKNKVFQPIELMIESQAELDYLIALSNSSITQVRAGAESLGFQLSSSAEAFQNVFYSQMCKLKD